MKWQKRIFFMCKVIIMVRNDLTVGSKKRSSFKAFTRARVLPQCFTFSQSPNHTATISLIFWALLWLKAPVTLRHAFVYFARLSVTQSMEVFTKNVIVTFSSISRPTSTGPNQSARLFASTGIRTEKTGIRTEIAVPIPVNTAQTSPYSFSL